MPNCAFVDSSNLNVLFKTDNGFQIGMNYSRALDKLGFDIQALGLGYDVYLTLWPRPDGTGDYEVKELCRSGLPFVMLAAEYDALVSYFSSLPGLGTLYLCNGLQNYIVSAKVTTFESVFYYGQRVAYVKVANSLVDDFRVYGNSAILMEDLGESFNCYGDADLVHLDRIRVQYPETASWEPQQIVACAAMITSYQNNCARVAASSIDCETGSAYIQRHLEEHIASTPDAIVDETNESRSEENMGAKIASTLSQESVKIKNINRNTKRSGFNPITLVLLLVMLVVTALPIGRNYGMISGYAEVKGTLNAVADKALEAEKLNAYKKVYQNSWSKVSYFCEAVDYCKANNFGVTVAGWEYYYDRMAITCYGPAEASEQFVKYVGAAYDIESRNELGTQIVAGADQQQFGLVIQ